MNLIEENEYFRIIGDDSFIGVKDKLSTYLNFKIRDIMNFFDIENIDTINIYLYSDPEKFSVVSKYPYVMKDLAGTFYLSGVRVYANLDNVSNEKLFSCLAHEISHLLYINYVQEKGVQNRVVWFDEGLAQNLSGEKDYLLDDENLSNYLIKNIYNEDKIVPSIEYLCTHGNEFGNFVDGESNKYNGYVWSYLMVRYLLKIIPKEYFDIIMRSKLEIDVIGRCIVDSTYNYYKRKVKVK